MKIFNKSPIFFLIAALTFPLQACATNYSAEPIEAWVVDAESGQPVEGVVVVAHWQLEGGLEGGNNLGQMMVMEAVTDQAGKFSFPAWGPKKVPDDFSWATSNARLKNMDPEMLLFKNGYKYLRLQNDKPLEELGGMKPYVRTSEWNGKTVKMVKFKGSLREYAQHLNYLDGYLERTAVSEYGYCEWKNIPLMILAIGKQSKIFETANISHSSIYNSLLPNEEAYARKGCGSVNEFLKGQVK